MVHHACRRLYGDNCYFADNSWKRYQRANSGDTLIFNFGNTCCGGGYHVGCGGGGFWSNFGAGIGLGLANLFGGFLNGMMTPFMGGFMNPYGMMGGFTMPFAMTSGTNPWGIGASGTGNNSGNKSDKTEGAGGEDDVPVLGGSNGAKSDAGNSSNVNGNNGNGGNNDGATNGTPAASNSSQTQGATNSGTNPSNAASANNSGNAANVNTPTDANPDGLDEITGLTPEDKEALREMGVRKVDLAGYTNPQPIVGLGLPKDITKANLEKLQSIANKHNIPIACGHNATNTVDHWVAGKIGDIAENSGKISFTINCKDVGKAGGNYKFTQSEGVNYSAEKGSNALNSGWTYNTENTSFTYEVTKGYMESNEKVANCK